MNISDLETKKIGFLKNINLFNDVNTEVLVSLAKLCSACDFRKGDIIFQEGESPDYVHFVQKGKIKFFGNSSTGKIIVVSFAWDGDIIGLANIFTGKLRWLSAQACSSVIALRIPRQDFLLFIKDKPDLCLKIMQMIEPLLQDIFNRFRAMVAYSVQRRVINYIFDLYDQYGINIPFSNEEIAGLIGSSRESVGRVIKNLCAQNLIEKHRARIKITDIPGLRKLRMPNWLR